jgi:hypothetical protein
LAEKDKTVVWSDLAGFKVKIPDVEIEFSSPDAKEVHKRFNEVMDYLKEILSSKTKPK